MLAVVGTLSDSSEGPPWDHGRSLGDAFHLYENEF